MQESLIILQITPTNSLRDCNHEKNGFQKQAKTAGTGWVSTTILPEVSLNDGIMFINGSVLNASSRVVRFAPNVENN